MKQSKIDFQKFKTLVEKIKADSRTLTSDQKSEMINRLVDAQLKDLNTIDVFQIDPMEAKEIADRVLFTLMCIEMAIELALKRGNLK